VRAKTACDPERAMRKLNDLGRLLKRGLIGQEAYDLGVARVGMLAEEWCRR
jgi:hypothetical protein